MTESKGLKPTFEKLNGKNYTTWSYRMKLFLKTEKCWDVFVLEQRPATITLKKWNDMEERATYLISVLIENNQLPFIKRTKSAKEAWEALAKHHKKSTFSNKIRLLRKLYHETLPKNSNMEVHLSKLMEYYDELCEIDHVVDDQQFVSIVMTSVGEDYDNLITALDCRDEKDLTFDLVKSKLMDEYERKKKKVDDFTFEGESVSGMKHSPKKYCDFCKESGHMKRFCGKFDNWLADKKKDKNVTKEATNEAVALIACKESDSDDGYDYLF